MAKTLRIFETHFSDPVRITMQGKKAEIMQKLIQLFAQNGIELEQNDREHGLIRTKTVGLGGHYQLKGDKIEPHHWAICERQFASRSDSLYIFPNKIQGSIRVEIAQLSDNLVEVSLLLHQFRAEEITSLNPAAQRTKLKMETSHQLEWAIADWLRNDTATTFLTLQTDPPDAWWGESEAQLERRGQLAAQTVARQDSRITDDVQKTSKNYETGYTLALVIGLIWAILQALADDEE